MILLASQSPRRAQLLEQLGVSFRVVRVAVVEQRHGDESAEDYVQRTAREKAQAGLERAADDRHALVLGADTEVVLDDDVFGKPADVADAERMLARLAGREHRVLSAVALLNHERSEVLLQTSIVRFAALDAEQISAYVATGEPFGKAGGYAIQGRAAGFIERLSGSYSGVMGLPLFETRQLLGRFGLAPE
jgi:septum formation protein